MFGKVRLILLFLLPGTMLFSQTTETKISLAYPVYSQYLHNGLIINPAYAGSREALNFFSSYRMQWMGVKGAPTSETVSLHTLLKNDRVGLGFYGQLFQYGFTRATSIYGNYAFHVRAGKSKLALGLKAGFDMSNTDYNGIILTDKTQTDPVFTSNDKPYMLPNVGAGAYFYNTKFFIGAAVPSFLAYAKNSAGDVVMKPFGDIDIQATAGILLSFSPAFKFKPSVLVNYSLDNTKGMRIDVNGNFIIYDFLWIGGSWRTSEEVAVGILQMQVSPKLMLGFSYDYPIGNLNTYSKGSTEVVLRFEFGNKISAANPRYF